MKHMIFGRTNNVFTQFFRYFWVGASSAVVDLAIFTFCIYVLELPWLTAAVLGYGVGIVWNYIISILWVFTSKNVQRELLLVFAVGTGGLLLTWAILYVCITLLGWNEVIAKVTSQVLILAWNFSLRKWFVF